MKARAERGEGGERGVERRKATQESKAETNTDDKAAKRKRDSGERVEVAIDAERQGVDVDETAEATEAGRNHAAVDEKTEGQVTDDEGVAVVDVIAEAEGDSAADEEAGDAAALVSGVAGMVAGAGAGEVKAGVVGTSSKQASALASNSTATGSRVTPGDATAAGHEATRLVAQGDAAATIASDAEPTGDEADTDQSRRSEGKAAEAALPMLKPAASGKGEPSATPAAPIAASEVASSAPASSVTAGGGDAATTKLSASAASAASPGVANAGDAEPDAVNAARMARGLNAAVKQQGGSLTLRLTPPELGTVRIELQIAGGTLAANFHAETEPARAMLTQQMSHLRRALEAQGLNVERLSVQTMGEPGRGGEAATGDDSGRRETAGDGRSRGSFGRGEGERRFARTTTSDFEQFATSQGLKS